MNPGFAAPYANLGQLYRRKQNLVKAIYYLQKRVEMGDPTDPWTQKARDDLNDIYSSTPLYRDRFLDAETNRLNLQTSQQTRETFKNQIRVANSEYERGLLLLKQQRTADAIKAFNDSLAFAPENPKVVQARNEAMRQYRAEKVSKQVEKAMQLLHEGHEQAAKQIFSEILTIIPNQPN
jgi:tetratricopeptide (TPR) repeat protein